MIRKTGKLALLRLFGPLFAALSLFAGAGAHADPEISVTAQATPEQITVDDSVNLRISVKINGSANVTQPEFKAPDFEVINEYQGSYVESYYENGQFGMRNTQQITKVLKPMKAGDLQISGITVRANGKIYSANSNFVIHVLPSGAGTPPPRGYGGSGIGLRGAGKHGGGPSVIVRAEVDKDKVYKGEQIIVSYFLYRRVRVFNIQVDKYPTLNGFLREDLEMPVLGTRLDSDRVLIDGIPYERSLLVRYAAYPLTEGKLHIDELGLKYNYYGGPQGMGDDEQDPLMNFFQQMAPHAGAQRNEPVAITVEPLPEEGRPNSFTGGVGDFNIVSAVDKYDVRANEPVTLTVKIEGRGNLEGISEPKAQWPDNVELYDSKGKTGKTGRGGVGEKMFEFLLIPRVTGKLQLPAIEFSYFDPAKKQYFTRKTEPISLNVLEPAPGSAAALPSLARTSPGAGAGAGATAGQSAQGTKEEVQGLKDLGTADSVDSTHGISLAGIPFWRWLYWICGAVLAVFALLVLKDFVSRLNRSAALRAELRAKEISRSWQTLREKAQAAAAGAPWNEVSQSYELLCSQVFDGIDRVFGIGARSYPRSELRELLVSQHRVPIGVCDKISNLLEFAELVRFAGSAGSPHEKAARSQMLQWVTEGESIARELASHKSK